MVVTCEGIALALFAETVRFVGSSLPEKMRTPPSIMQAILATPVTAAIIFHRGRCRRGGDGSG